MESIRQWESAWSVNYGKDWQLSESIDNSSRWANNPKVGSSNPPPATIYKPKRCKALQRFLFSEKMSTKCASRGAKMTKKLQKSTY